MELYMLSSSKAIMLFHFWNPSPNQLRMISLKAFDHPFLKTFKNVRVYHIHSLVHLIPDIKPYPEVAFCKCRGVLKRCRLFRMGWQIAPSYMCDRLEFPKSIYLNI